MISAGVINKANVLKDELQAQCVKGVKLYQSGTMRRSIVNNRVGDTMITTIAVPYASYTNNTSRDAGWIGRTVADVNNILKNNGAYIRLYFGNKGAN